MDQTSSPSSDVLGLMATAFHAAADDLLRMVKEVRLERVGSNAGYHERVMTTLFASRLSWNEGLVVVPEMFARVDDGDKNGDRYADIVILSSTSIVVVEAKRLDADHFSRKAHESLASCEDQVRDWDADSGLYRDLVDGRIRPAHGGRPRDEYLAVLLDYWPPVGRRGSDPELDPGLIGIRGHLRGIYDHVHDKALPHDVLGGDGVAWDYHWFLAIRRRRAVGA